MNTLELFRFAKSAGGSNSSEHTISTNLEVTAVTKGFEETNKQIDKLQSGLEKVSKTPATINSNSKEEAVNVKQHTDALKENVRIQEKYIKLLEKLNTLGLRSKTHKVTSSIGFDSSKYKDLMTGKVNSRLDTNIQKVSDTRGYDLYQELMKNTDFNKSPLPKFFQDLEKKVRKLIATMDELGVSTNRALKVTGSKPYNSTLYKTLMENLDMRKVPTPSFTKDDLSRDQKLLQRMKKLGVLIDKERKIIDSKQYDPNLYKTFMSNFDISAAPIQKFGKEVETTEQKVTSLIGQMHKLGIANSSALKVLDSKKYDSSLFNTFASNVDLSAMTTTAKFIDTTDQKITKLVGTFHKLGIAKDNALKVTGSKQYDPALFGTFKENINLDAMSYGASFKDEIETIEQRVSKLIARLDELGIAKNRALKVTGSRQFEPALFNTLMNNTDFSATKAMTRFKEEVITTEQKVTDLLNQMDKLGVAKPREMKVMSSKQFDPALYKTIITNLDTTGKAFAKVGEEAEKAGQKSKNFITRLSDGFNSLQLVKLVYLARSIRRVTSSMVAAVENAADYEESLNLYRLALGKYYDEANKWSDTITTKLMLDPRDVMQYTGAFYNLTKGMQVSKDAAFLMSKNLTQLTYDMSSYLNISVEAAQAKIQSAMAGQSRAVQSVGIATQSASLQELAYTLGIKKKVETMTQAEKTYLRYIQLMRSTTHMQGDLGRTMITPANTIRILKTQIQLLSRAIGQVLTVVLMKAMPYIMAFTNILTDLATKLADLWGYEFAPIDYSTTFEEYGKSLNQFGDSAENAGKKVKNSLAPFDELNVVMSSSATAGDLGGFGPSDYDKFLPSYDMLKDYTDQFKKQAEEVEGKLKSILITAGLIWGAFKIGKLIKGFFDFTTILGKIPGIGSVISTVFGKSATAAGKTAEAAGDAAKSAGLLSKIPWAKILGFAGGAALSGFSIYRKEKNVDKLQEGTLNGDEVEEKYLMNTLGTVAGGTIAGASVGGPLGAIIGTGVGAVASVIQDLKLLNETIKDGDVNVKYFSDDLKKAYADTEPAILETYESITDLNNSLGVTPAQKNKVINSVKGLMDEITENVTESKESHAKLINDAVKKGIMTEEEAKKVLDNTDKHYATLTEKAETAQKKINEILKKYGDDQTRISAEDKAELEKQYKVLEEATVGTITTMNGKQTAILRDLANKKKEISIESASEMIKSSIEVRDKAIAAANEQYTSVLEEAGKMKAAGLITDEQYEKIVNDAEKARDDAVTAAEEQHNQVYQEFVDSHGDIAKYIDEDTGGIKSKWEVFWSDVFTDFEGTIIKPIKKFFDETLPDIWSNFKEWWKDKLTVTFDSKFTVTSSSGRGATSSGGRRYATGGYPTSGELFFANENGAAEFITKTGNKTAVYNQDQMVSALTNAIVSGFHSLGNGSSGPQNLTVQIGNDKIYKGQVSYQNRQVDRYGTSKTIKV